MVGDFLAEFSVQGTLEELRPCSRRRGWLQFQAGLEECTVQLYKVWKDSQSNVIMVLHSKFIAIRMAFNAKFVNKNFHLR